FDTAGGIICIPLTATCGQFEDLDGDGAFDIFEDRNRNGRVDGVDLDGDGIIECGYRSFESEDADCDGRLTTGSSYGRLDGACEGVDREDLDCDGHLDWIDEDLNGNGRLDLGFGEDLDLDGRFDRGIEDRNGNQYLDDRPFPATDPLGPDNDSPLYPYGRLAPCPPVAAGGAATVTGSRGGTSE
ncbi:MAG TPA: hypothetical protein VFG08_03720, partial [Candidatus Polarisedimenticolia bacterium]|nr:hypothetical protein [Candidatus Polarisedimenticolia bacterium]